MRKHTMLLGAAALGFAAFGAQAQDDVIAQRQALMKDNSARLAEIRNAVAESSPDTALIAENARALAENGMNIPELFPEGSDEGQTRALPAIWENWDEFEGYAQALETNAQQLAQTAEGGADQQALTTQFAAIARESCGPCHNEFRGPE